MGRRKQDYLKQIYKQNPETKAYIIEISLDEYNEVFNGWDPSPFKRRDLDHDFLDFIEECGYDISLKYQVELHFVMPKKQYDERKESLTVAGIRNNFRFIIHFIKKEIAENRRKTIMYMIMSFTFLTLAYLSNKYLVLDIVTNTLVEGLFIGGWIFLWEAFSLFFFSNQEINIRLRKYYRFLKTPIIFDYK